MRFDRFAALALGLTLLGAADPQAPPAAADAQAFSIAKYVNTFTPDRSEKTAAGYQFWFVDKTVAERGKTLKLSVVGPHLASHPPHKHPEDEFFLVLEGQAEFFLGGQRVVAGPSTSLYCPPNIEHGIRNVGDTELKYLVIKEYGSSTSR